MSRDADGNTKGTANTTDVIVLGVGTCGEDISLRLLDAGLDVVGIERSLVGGECACWACLPSKAMIRAAELMQEARRVDGKAGHADLDADWSQVAARVRNEVTGGWDDAAAVRRFAARGGHLVHESGRLIAKDTVSAAGETFAARKGIVIATGSQPAIPPIAGLAEVDHWTTHDVIKLETLPHSLLVLGGGAVGCELGQVLSRFGVEVTIVEASERLLPAEEPEASQALQDAFAAEGIAVHLGASVEHVRSQDGLIVATLTGGDAIASEHLLVATGRRVELGSLGLGAAGLDPSAPFISVDGHLRAGEGIWAMGDVTGKGMFTHVALRQSAIVAADILGADHTPADYHAVPRATLTDPEVGGVGLTEADALAAGRDVAVVVKEMPATFRGWLHGVEHGMLKLVLDRETGALIGATAVGPRGGEVLGVLTLAVHARIPLAQLRDMIYAFPTFHGVIGEAVGAYGRGLTTVLDPITEV